MRAIVFEEFGGPEVLRVSETAAVPSPGPGQIRVQVKAAGVNQLDHKIRSGVLNQLFPTELPAIPGGEFSGIVDALGEGVTHAAIGDEVLGWTETGAYAEYAIAGTVVPKPEGLGWREAAALPGGTETAHRVLRELGIERGETLLLHGAAGVVGSMAVQFAVERGATVIGTASAANHDFLRGLGAHPVAYGDGLAERVREVTGGKDVDAVFDAAGQGVLPLSVELRGGTTERIVTIADLGAREHGVAFSRGEGEPIGRFLAEDARRVAAGELTVRIADAFPLKDAEAAQRRSEAGHAKGKLLLVP
ncbi:NADP-dependent oxidoreductase [Streptomyces sp. NPDC059063]|uniref:NADP-dependent oxidoreductase n=1 Tax=unclassified Streptomyces TaxID=2593676 RepID=UPI00369A51EA